MGFPLRANALRGPASVIAPVINNMTAPQQLRANKVLITTSSAKPNRPLRGQFGFAEGVGFEPTVPEGTAVFETARFNRSRTLP